VLSLRARLTAWYSVLLLLSLALFTATVLWINWRLMLESFDETLAGMSVTADNLLREEVGELHDLGNAAAEMIEVVHQPGVTIAVFDDKGAAIQPVSTRPPLASDGPVAPGAMRSVRAPDGSRWRVTWRRGDVEGHAYAIAVGAPLDGPVEEWWRLVRTCAIGIPVALALAIGGGWWIGREGLRPLQRMSDESQAITARTPEARLSPPRAGRELDRVAGAFNLVLDRLGSALSTQRRFMADASHELRTPLSTMRTAADVTLSQPTRDEAEYREALTEVAQQTSRLSRLVDDMFVLARADGGGYPLNPTDIDLDAIVDDVVREFRPSAETKRIDLRVSVVPAPMRGDEALLRRMFVNLLNNALTYTPAGGAVDVAVIREGRSLVLRVRDTGVGIPSADRERVFERFVRLDSARGAGGAGLGLSIARWIAEVHGGTLQVETSGPGGTVFAARLSRP
jgi:heavy metal sensor kinase